MPNISTEVFKIYFPPRGVLDQLINYLKSIGLTSGEARVYVALLTLGQSRISSIVKESGVSSSKIYFVIEKLIEKGLISYIDVGKLRKYSAIEPYRLEEYLDKKVAQISANKSRLHELLPLFSKHQVLTDTIGAEIFSGLKGLKSAYQRLLNGSIKSDILRYIYPYDTPHPMATEFYSKYLLSPIFSMEIRGIIKRNIVYNPAFNDIFDADNMRYVDFPLPAAIDLINDRLLIISWSNRPTGILISSKEIYSNFESYFDMLWVGASPIIRKD